METKQAVKMESLMGGGGGASNYHYLAENHHPYLASSSSLGFESEMLGKINNNSSGSSSSGFMELLGMQDMINISPSLFDMVINGYEDHNNLNILDGEVSLDSPAPSDPTTHHEPTPVPSNVNQETSNIIINNNNSNNLPTTPNSSSISSASNDELHHNSILSPDDDDDDEVEVEEEEELQQKAKKQWTKPKKTSQKRPRQPRVAFMTKSEVDHLEDGYRWRKYGQKAVKNSPFPRSYYRCTSASCNVKKRVERSFTDPSIVVTTYEGQHTHPCTVLPRGMMPVAGFGPGMMGATASAYALPMQMMSNNNTSFSHQLQMNYINSLVPQLSHFGSNPSNNNTMLSAQDRRICGAAPVNSALLTDNGLLQDIVPSIMKKEDDDDE